MVVSVVAVWTWVGAVVLALVVLGFCAYELAWKLRRLGRDVERLQEVGSRLTDLQVSVARARTGVTTINGLRPTSSTARRTPLLPATGPSS